VFLGSLPDRWKTLTDINGRELFTLVPLAIIVIFLGIYPAPAINLMTSAVNTLVNVINQGGGVAMIGH
jgi:NADH-quinone oxidoreductase subunit M